MLKLLSMMVAKAGNDSNLSLFTVVQSVNYQFITTLICVVEKAVTRLATGKVAVARHCE